MQAAACRYDLERFGCLEREDPAHADLLIISGAVTRKMAEEVRAVYDKMPSPRFVMAVGACACSGGLFQEQLGSPVVPGVNEIVPVDVFVPGCPPRPEAIMNGLVNLQDKIMGRGQKR
jgi:NADH-quinone oxidoreductase subunit B